MTVNNDDDLGKPALIGDASRVGNRVYRARDVRADIKELGFEKGIERAVTLIVDEQVGIRQSIKDFSELLDKMIDLVAQNTNIGATLAQKLQEIDRREGQFDESRGQGIIPPRNS